jgi:hypothetical protein
MAKYETDGFDPKVPAMALAMIISFIVGETLIDLPVYITMALATVISAVSGYFAPAPKTNRVFVPKKLKNDAGYAGVDLLVQVLVLVIVVVLVVWLLKHLI